MTINEIVGVVDSVSASLQAPEMQEVKVVVNTGLSLKVEVSALTLQALGLVQGRKVVLTIPGEAIGIGDQTSRINWGDLAEDENAKRIIHVDPLGTRWIVEAQVMNGDHALLLDFLNNSELLLSAVPISDEDYKFSLEHAQPFDTLKDDEGSDGIRKPQISIAFRLDEHKLAGPVRINFLALVANQAPEAHELARAAAQQPLVVSYNYDASDTQKDSDVDISYNVSGDAIDLYLGSSTSANLLHRGPLSKSGTISPFIVAKASSGKVTAQARTNTKWYRLGLDINAAWS